MCVFVVSKHKNLEFPPLPFSLSTDVCCRDLTSGACENKRSALLETSLNHKLLRLDSIILYVVFIVSVIKIYPDSIYLYYPSPTL